MPRESCEGISARLVEFADGELPEADRGRVEAHVSDCAACRAELARLRRSLELAQSVWQKAAFDVAASCPPIAANEGSLTPIPRNLRMFQRSVPLLRRSSALLTSAALLALRQAVAHGSEKRVPRFRGLVAAAAVCAATVLVVLGAWLLWRPGRGGEVASVASVSSVQHGGPGGEERPPGEPALPGGEKGSNGVAAPAGKNLPAEDVDVEAIIAREGRAARLAAAIAFLATEPSLKEYHDRAERHLQETYPETAPARTAGPVGKLPVKEPKS